jgi:hypothetical protein
MSTIHYLFLTKCLLLIKKMERNKNPKGNAKHGKIENVAGSV